MKKSRFLRKWNTLPLTVRVSVAYTVSSIIQRSFSFITLPLFTRLLTQEQYGQQTVYSSWQSLLIIFITLQLPYGSFSTAMVKFEDKRDEYIASVEGIFLLFSACFLIMYYPFRYLWNKLFQLPTFIIIIMIGEIICNASIALWNGKKRFEYKYVESISLTLGMLIISTLLQLLLVLHFEQKGYARIIGCAVVAIITGGVIFVREAIKGKSLFNKEFWNYALGFNIPLLIYYLSQMIFNMSDRIMISHMVGVDKAAVYGVAYNLAVMLNFVLGAINNSYIPWFYGKLKERKQEANKIVANSIAILMSVMLLGIIWFAPEIILVMAGKSYMEAIWVVPPVAMSILLLFYAQLSINFEFYFEKKKMLVMASVGAALTNIVLNYTLIPRFGYCAAGYTTLFSYILFAIMNYHTMDKIAEEQNLSDNGLDVRSLSIILLVFMILGFTGMALYSYIFIRVIMAVIVCVGVCIKRKTFFDLWETIREQNKSIQE